MSLKFTLRTQPSVPLEADNISPDKLEGLSVSDIEALPAYHGNEQVSLGDFFKIEGTANGEVVVEGDLKKVKMIGTKMSQGRMVIHGDVGMHLGTGMSGGEIIVDGNAGDWAGAEMSGGLLEIKGNAGNALACNYRGTDIGMLGGEIFVHGNAGSEVGGAMRRGLIAVAGDTGDFTGVNMLAGSIIVLGNLGWRTAAGMVRGTIVSMHEARILPTFTYATTYKPSFLRLYLLRLREMGFPVEDAQLNGLYRRWSGDSVELNRGEILIFDG
jgi:formylmethanofuran dehydrogenase subunit C